MKRFLVLSDTHVQSAASIPSEVFAAAERADHILHAGDLSVYEVITVLEKFAPVTAVHGNVEVPECFGYLPRKQYVDIEGVRVGMVHDAGQADGRHQRLMQEFPEANLIIYGHSHLPEIAQPAPDVTIVNPGSSTQRRKAPAHTFVWVDVSEEQSLNATLVELGP